jgi:predicted regulator of Ras-like GTPase activity (Roadblock/LC7/MglB family)
MSWLLASFADQIPGVAHVVAVSADGILLASSRGLPPDRAEQLAAVTAGLISLAQGVSQATDGGRLVQTVVEMAGGFLFLMSISDGSALAAWRRETATSGRWGMR